MTVTLTTVNNQKNVTNDKNNITTILFDECEEILRDKNKIPDDDMLYMIKYEVKK